MNQSRDIRAEIQDVRDFYRCHFGVNYVCARLKGFNARTEVGLLESQGFKSFFVNEAGYVAVKLVNCSTRIVVSVAEVLPGEVITKMVLR